MNKIIHKSDTRGRADYGWLKPHYSFSFAGYYNPERVHFGMLRVLNDDWIGPGGGFDTHPHDNMEIVTIPLTGSLEHKDSMGHTSVISAGEVQVMSAGTGITHSEYNHSKTEPLTLLQIWVFPGEKGVKPRYGQKTFDMEAVTNVFEPVVTPEKYGSNLWLHQDTWFSLGRFDAYVEAEYTLHHSENGAYLFVIDGAVETAGETLGRRDAIGTWGTGTVKVRTTAASQLLLIEVPMR
jgi:redox-sensitive bicupin YhaK (pirin superfamily)